MEPVRFTFDGQPLEARPGDSIASALTAAGIRAFRTTQRGEPRGLYCGMGVCQDCLVTVDGRRSQRACMTLARADMDVTRQHDDNIGQPPGAAGDGNAVSCDLIVVGAGPAGLGAACVAAEAGLSVMVLDERDETGGQYFKPRSEGSRHADRPDRQHREGLALRGAARLSGAAFLTGQTIWFARHEAGRFIIASYDDKGSTRVTARALVLAAGAYEQPALVPGWTLPGSMTIGAGQTLARRYGVSPGENVLVAGHGPLGLQLAAEILSIGGRVAALLERGSPSAGRAALGAGWRSPHLLLKAAGYRARLLRAGIPVLYGWELARIEGGGAVDGAVACRLDGAQERRFDVDTVCAGDGFAPQTELARLLGCEMDVSPRTGLAHPRRAAGGETATAGLWIAGDGGGLQGAEAAQAQGRLAGRGAARHLGRSVSDDAADRRKLDKALAFQRRLWPLYRAPPRRLPTGNTVICRCEGVTAADAEAAIAAGAADAGAIKRATRLGMGRCQGRYCLQSALRLLAQAGHPPAAPSLFAPQLPARPVPVAALAREKPEWGGHRESRPSARPAELASRPLAFELADLIVIGAGVTGLTAALAAAKAGARVMLLDRGRLHAEASGGNAGSLHLQLLSWDFGSKAFGDGSAAMRTLPLQRDSIALWSELEHELSADFEMQMTGGMMVAEDREQIRFLEQKAAAEAKVGIHTEVIDGPRIRQIAPAVSERMVAAAWCPGEGKINPLLAGHALAGAAVARGVAVEELAAVTGIARDGNAYAVSTGRGTVRAKNLVIAAGGWTADIARMLGADIPLRGAPLQMIVTESAPPLVPCLLAHAARHLTMKQTAAGTLLIGGAWPAETAPDGQARVLPESLEGNLWVAQRTVPAVAALHVVRAWAAMNIDIDGAPMIGPLPGHPAVIVAATANGYTLGPLMGREAAAMALGGTVPLALVGFGVSHRG